MNLLREARALPLSLRTLLFILLRGLACRAGGIPISSFLLDMLSETSDFGVLCLLSYFIAFVLISFSVFSSFFDLFWYLACDH